jgi:DNA-binding NarL/FixJ family response regulator
VLLSLRSQANGSDAPVSVADLPDFTLSLLREQRRPGPDKPRRGIPSEQWPEVLRRVEQGDTLRQVAHDYGVSHETVRRTVKAARKQQGGEA